MKKRRMTGAILWFALIVSILSGCVADQTVLNDPTTSDRSAMASSVLDETSDLVTDAVDVGSSEELIESVSDASASVSSDPPTDDDFDVSTDASERPLPEISDNPPESIPTEEARALGYIIVTDTVPNDGQTDVADGIQKLIDENPNRTIYFPDGTYRIGKPILTPADPLYSVDLQLSNYAMIIASSDWNHSEAMIRLGGKKAANDIGMTGSCYSFTGGIVDGNERANGISIDSGRETAIRNVSIKNTVVGIHIKHGANSGSSDADISDVNIVGVVDNDQSIGVLVEGNDNTFTNMRIARVTVGIYLKSGANMMRNIHPLYSIYSPSYEKSYGFYDTRGDNFYDMCYSDQFRYGFYVAGDRSNVYDSCYCYWYSSKGDQTAIRAGEKFNSLVTNIRVGFRNDNKKHAVLEVGSSGGNGVIEYVLTASPSRLTDKTYEQYLIGKVLG